MQTGRGWIIELLLEDGRHLARISCPPALIPAPGQYLLAGEAGHTSDSPLSVPLFYTDSAPEGFIVALPGLVWWTPSQEIALRGPCGSGFRLPGSARKVALVAFDDSPMRLRGLIQPALKQGAAVVLVSDFGSNQLPDEVEIQPLAMLGDVITWADYVALDVARENLPATRDRLDLLKERPVARAAQVMVRARMPCGGVAECGICAVSLRSGWKMACNDGPVFEWHELA